MESSAVVSQFRPFYSRFAEAYDLLVADPVEPWVDAVAGRVAQPPARVELLDAGCGTGRHAAAFAARGYSVTLADASTDLLALACRRCPSSPARLVDLCTLASPPRYDVITCRGVLNDMVSDVERDAALRAMAEALRPGGQVFCDVREAKASASRADGTLTTKTVTLPDGGKLSFTSTSRWADGLLLVREEHLFASEPDQPAVYQFTMRPWTRQEITERFTQAGLVQILTQPGIGRTTRDRLFVSARRPD